MAEESSPKTPRAACVRFAIDETPFAVWSWDPKQENQDFLNRLDPGFFAYLAVTHVENLQDGDKAHRAALALRAAYSHALESFFALLGASLQAPFSIGAWLLKYNLTQLRSLVRKIQRGAPILTRFDLPRISFEEISTLVHHGLTNSDTVRQERVKELFAQSWSRFASDFLDQQFSYEYNAIKHGSRASSGGFVLSIGTEDAPGEALPPEKMSVLGGSRFGSSYLEADHLSAGNRNFRILRHSRNWLPDVLSLRIQVLSFSMSNIITFLLNGHGVDATELSYKYPDDDAVFDRLWHEPSVPRVSMNPLLRAENISPLADDEILQVYKLATDRE